MVVSRKGATLSSLVADGSEDEFAQSDIELLPTPDSQAENTAPGKRRAAMKSKSVVAKSSSRVTKAKATSRRISGAHSLAASSETAKSRKRGRPALKELEDVNDNGEVTEDVAEYDEEPPQKPVNRGRPVKPGAVVKSSNQSGRSRPTRPKRNESVEPARTYIPDTQPEPMQIESTILQEHDENDNPAAVQPSVSSRPATHSLRHAGSIPRQTETLIAPRRRAGSASSTERGGDPALRRKLGDMTRRFENLDLKYKQLKDVGSTEALTNFEKLRRSTEQRAQDQDNLIASLRKELAAQKALLTESSSLRKQLAASEIENARLSSQVKDLTKDLQGSQKEVRELQQEIKTLSTKLSAARSSAQPEQSRQNNVQKANGARSNTAPPALRGEDSAIMKLKEDLYSDLTGLMIRTVKRGDDEDVYDCIQTGRNGTLRFHLFVSHLPPETTTPGAANAGYDDTEFGYMPLFDEKNDRELMDILPDYLCEDISFPRAQAAKFYAKIVESMSRKVEFEE